MRQLAFALTIAITFALTARAQVHTAQGGGTFLLDNSLVTLRLSGQTLTAKASATEFARQSNLPAGETSIVDVTTPLGAGKAIQLKTANGADLIILFPDSPFVFFRHDVRNATQTESTTKSLTSFTLLHEADPKSVRVLGCDGLTPGDRSRASYTFLAAADPETRGGVVAGWITHERASGIVLCAPGDDGKSLAVRAQSDYGALRLRPGGGAQGELFAIGRFDDCLTGLEAYADAVGRYHEVKLKPAPAGYCTWYSRPNGGAANENTLAELARFVHEKLQPFGFEVVQIDDKWQVANRDYTTHKPNGPYAGGMKPTADAITRLGLTPGLWFIPFGWDPKRPAFEGHQDYFVHHADGSLYEVKWAGTCLDMTHPAARQFLADTVARMTREWGFRYLKIDGLWTGLAVQILYPKPEYRDDKIGDAVFHEPGMTNVQAFREGLRTVRNAAGPDVFIDGCNVAQNMRTLGASFGLVDAMRVGRDTGADWSKILPSAEMGTRLYFFQNRVWHNDPDCLMLREPLTLEQARAWGSWIALSGQLNIVSEWLPALPEDRLDVIRRSMPNAGVCGRPVDLFEREMPQVWRTSSPSAEKDHPRDVIGLFNWDAKNPTKVSVPFKRLGLGQGGYVGFDFWRNAFVGPVTEKIEAELPPGSCRVIALRPVQAYPQVLGTSRHITQGILDLREEKWDAATRTLSGTSKVVGGDPYELRIATPTGMKAARVEADQGRIEIVDGSQNTRVRITVPANETVRWRVAF
jgi:hypothetical protein